MNKQLKKRKVKRISQPVYPGVPQGTPVDLVEQMMYASQKFNLENLSVLGVEFPIQGGGQTDQQKISISGVARLWAGYSVFSDAGLYPEAHSLTINNEKIINEVHSAMFSPNFLDKPFYPIMRTLSGSDTIEMSFRTTGGAQNLYIAIFYLSRG